MARPASVRRYSATIYDRRALCPPPEVPVTGPARIMGLPRSQPDRPTAGSHQAWRADGRRRKLGGRRDLPEVAVRVAEVPEVPPLNGGCFLHNAGTGRRGLAHDLVH